MTAPNIRLPAPLRSNALTSLAFALGGAAVLWVGFGYREGHALALAMTALIGAFYLMGAAELRRFQQATASLQQALARLPDDRPQLAGWLAQLHPTLQNPVRQRIEGERASLPGPVMTPTLVGLLVLLGMLGTFLGMVVTLNGTALALDSSTDPHTIRAALSAPVKGLGLAFGTSVAGVAASAMLGLMSALCRRARLQAAQALDSAVATRLRPFSLAHQREETFRTVQAQALLVPEVIGQLQAGLQATLQSTLQALSSQLERQALALNERLLANQDSLLQHTRSAYTGLADSVTQSLNTGLAEATRTAGASLQPVAQATLAGLAQEAGVLHDRLAHSFEQASARLLTTVESHLAGSQAAMAAAMQQSVDRQAGALQQAMSGTTESLQQAMADTTASLRQALAGTTESLHAALTSTTSTLQQAWQQAGASSLAQQQQICQTLAETARDIHAQGEAQAGRTIAELARLAQAVAEAPRAAADIMGQLRQQLSDSLARDNQLLAERQHMMDTLGSLLAAIQQAATEQRGAIDALVASSASVMQQVGAQFSQNLEAESTRLADTAAQVTGGAVELASLGEAFGLAVERFSASSEALVGTLQRIEGALGQSAARSDEQLAYYVAQAREVIDLSLLSQQQIMQDLQQLASRQPALAAEAD